VTDTGTKVGTTQVPYGNFDRLFKVADAGLAGSNVTLIPEPSTLVLLAAGLLGLLAYAWRRLR